MKIFQTTIHFTTILLLIIVSIGCRPASPLTLEPTEIVVENNPVPLPIPTPQPTFVPISFAWFYHAPAEGVDPNFLAENFNLFISTRELEEGRDLLRRSGSTASFYQYVVFNEVLQPATCESKPFDSQAASHPGDYCLIDSLQPDWFLMTRSGERVRDKPPHDTAWLMDPSKAGWRQFWLERVLERDFSGWDGIFLDNLEARPRYHEDDLLNFPHLADFQNANQDFLRMIYQEFHARNLKVFANILNVTNLDEWRLYLPYLDGVMIENFAVDWSSGDHLTEEQWKLHMQSAIMAQAAGKDVILVARGDANDIPRQEFALASYYLVNNGKAYFRYTSEQYDELLWYENYLVTPGAPLGEMYSDNGFWFRSFENGWVSVDPKQQTASFNFSE